MKIDDYKKNGWTVRKDGKANYSLKNGSWNKIGGFKTEISAWSWLLKIREPRTKVDIEEQHRRKEREVLQARHQMKHDFF